MTSLNRKIEVATGVMAVALMVSLGHFMNGIKGKSPSEIMNLVYKMPRPASYSAAGFDLSDREVESKYINPFEKKNTSKKVDTPKTTEVAKAAAKTANAQKSTKATAAKKTEVSVSVVEKNDNNLTQQEVEYSGARNGNTSFTATTQNDQTADAQNTAKDVLSSNQWRSLLSAQPTSANLNALIAAYSKKEVDAATFYTIMQDLISNSKSEVQVLGVAGLNATPSVQSFKMLVHSQSVVADSVETQVTKAISYYVNYSRQGIILAVLASNDSSSVLKAIEVVMTGYSNAKSGSTSDSRGDRGEVTEQSLASYLKFIPVLRTLQAGSDSNVASVASQALSVLSVIASN